MNGVWESGMVPVFSYPHDMVCVYVVCAHPHTASKRAERTPDLSSVAPQALSEHTALPAMNSVLFGK